MTTTKLELYDITPLYIRNKLGFLEDTDENNFDDPNNKHFDFGACNTPNNTNKAFQNNKMICDFFENDFKNVSFCIRSWKGDGFYFIYPKQYKDYYDIYDDKTYMYNVSFEDSMTEYFYRSETRNDCYNSTIGLLEEILKKCINLDNTIDVIMFNFKEEFKKELKKEIKTDLIKKLKYI
jgi:hypothetical protein